MAAEVETASAPSLAEPHKVVLSARDAFARDPVYRQLVAINVAFIAVILVVNYLLVLPVALEPYAAVLLYFPLAIGQWRFWRWRGLDVRTAMVFVGAHRRAFKDSDHLEKLEKPDVLRGEHFERMKDGALLANAGNYAHEIDVAALAATAVEEREVRRHVTEYVLADGRRIHLLAQGALVNIAASDGHPIEIMDLSFTVQALAIHYLARHRGELPPGVHPLPPDIDREIAAIKLETLGVAIDSLTDDQVEMRRRWQ